MANAIKTLLLAVLISIPLTTVADNNKPNDKKKRNTVDEVLVILSSDSRQTQGMAMVLSNTMAQKGAKVNVLLCDEAGDLALKAYEAEPLAPKNVSPGQMLRGLMKAGGTVNVCALYLPNSEHTKEDLLEGVGVATPPSMATQMLDRKMRTFTF